MTYATIFWFLYFPGLVNEIVLFFAGVCNIAHSSPGALHKTNFDSKDLPNGPHLSSHCGNVRPFFKLFEYVRSFISTMQHMLALCWSPSYSHMTFHCGR